MIPAQINFELDDLTFGNRNGRYHEHSARTDVPRHSLEWLIATVQARCQHNRQLYPEALHRSEFANDCTLHPLKDHPCRDSYRRLSFIRGGTLPNRERSNKKWNVSED